MESTQIPPTGVKKRRLQGACDICRSKKIRCDSAKMPGNICSNCRSFGSECTHLMSASKKVALIFSKCTSYVNMDGVMDEESQRSSALQDSPPTASPKDFNFDFAKTHIAAILSPSTTYKLSSDPSLILKTLTEISSYARALENELKNQNHSALYPLGSAPSSRPEQDYPNVNLEVSDTIKRLERLGVKDTFMGEESQLALLKEAMIVRNAYTTHEQKGGAELKRLEFWDPCPWQKLHDPTHNLPPLVFPDQDLLDHLVDLYFQKRNGMVLLHRPTFEQGLRDGLHKQDRDFGELVLSVCGLGAWYTDDPRVLADGTDSKHSLGWKYYEQIVLMQDLSRNTALMQLCFYNRRQSPVLAGLYLDLVYDSCKIVGAHRRNFYGPKPHPVKEQWKRAFWCLVCIDTYMSAFTGRPKATNPADYDLEFPAEVDDEYWLHPDPEQAFKQPVGRPSTVACWIHHLKLLDIFGVAQRSIHAVKKPQRWVSDPKKHDETVVEELDIALNKWVDTVPEHLRWDPHREDPHFFRQSATLYSDYYWVQIQIHRGNLKHNGMSYSSLAVSTNAARACVSVLTRLHSRGGDNAFPNTITSLSNCCVVLLLNLWSAKQLGIVTDPIRDMGNIHKCLEMLKYYEPRWQTAGRMCDIISELISASHTAIPTIPTEIATSRSSKRRHREDGDDGRSPSPAPTNSSKLNTSSNPMAGPSSLAPPSSEFTEFSLDTPTSHSSMPSASDFDFNLFGLGLPLHTEDLGRLPVHFMADADVGASDFHTHTEGSELYNPEEYSCLNLDPTGPYIQEPAPYIDYNGGDFGIPDVGTQMGAENINMQAQAALAMFQDSPRGDRWDDWGTYIANVDEFLRSLNPSPASEDS
ncbi:hypothetical protein BT96DRAFT_986942 [Gymnopus androsaceus JB14]|uniref:Zn(2)-C6 fungal-type domain-containing protein n=1 Tax=Gymnopus androsaceus JB14 TaxID=1447944 RepID=A0A6A4IAE7_9AGAR|nr:hypothetical protein BT96DRAFT_986942 [Gymnopus androsaceus JB14]